MSLSADAETTFDTELEQAKPFWYAIRLKIGPALVADDAA